MTANAEQNQTALLDLPISYFDDCFKNVPSQQTTLRHIVSTRDYQGSIETIRSETDEARQKKLKEQLPAITPVSLLHHRKADTSFAEKIATQYPMLLGDVDKKDNPGLDMAKLKTQISRLSYILLCAYSVRGGLWFVVRLPDNQTPESLAAHFKYLEKLFSQRFGVTLDSSKGDNPTHLRSVSYDAAPYMNENATVMPRTYTPSKPKPGPARTFVTNHPQPSGEWELKQVIKQARKAQKGDRHIPLLKAATLAGGYIGAERLDHDTAVCALETIASELDNFRDSERAIKDGIRNGQQKPLYADEVRRDSRPVSSPSPSEQPRQNNIMPSDGRMINGEVLTDEPPAPSRNRYAGAGVPSVPTIRPRSSTSKSGTALRGVQYDADLMTRIFWQDWPTPPLAWEEIRLPEQNC